MYRHIHSVHYFSSDIFSGDDFNNFWVGNRITDLVVLSSITLIMVYNGHLITATWMESRLLEITLWHV